MPSPPPSPGEAAPRCRRDGQERNGRRRSVRRARDHPRNTLLACLPYRRALQVRRVIVNYQTSGLNSEDGYWWALTANGEETRFLIDWCA